MIATLEPGRPLHLAFGSCRTSVSHDESGNRLHGVDALRAWALRVADQVEPADTDDPDLAPDRLPDLVLFLGDQVYADETTDAMREFIESRRDIEQPPWTELQDYEEYAHLYRLAWSDPANRWLLSTVPSAMIFDDHDIRDDWNTSLDWRTEMEATSWWHGRIVAGLEEPTADRGDAEHLEHARGDFCSVLPPQAAEGGEGAGGRVDAGQLRAGAYRQQPLGVPELDAGVLSEHGSRVAVPGLAEVLEQFRVVAGPPDLPSCISDALSEAVSSTLADEEFVEKAKELGMEVVTKRYAFSANARALMLGGGQGFVKTVAEKDGAVVGVHIIGPHATELLAECVVAMALETTAEEFGRIIHAHPTVSETIMEAAEGVHGMTIHM